jgi:MFS-type transporter involved in bile tolerance (Atg22 family)
MLSSKPQLIRRRTVRHDIRHHNVVLFMHARLIILDSYVVTVSTVIVHATIFDKGRIHVACQAVGPSDHIGRK